MNRLRVLDRQALLRAAVVDVEEARVLWQRTLAPQGSDTSPPLVSLLEDWADFSGLTYPEMLSAIFHAQEKVDQEWEEQRPQGPDEVAAFYDKTDTIIPLLLWWHATEIAPPRCAAAATSVLRAIGAEHILDFGSGIGSTALALSHAGFRVTLSEVAREVLRFAESRTRARGHDLETIDLLAHDLAELPAASYDGIVAFDVLEHLPETARAILTFDRLLTPGGVICFNEAYVPDDRDEPQHFPQRGEVVLQLHQLGYRLAHHVDVMWVAQKAPLRPVERFRQGLEIRSRIAAVKAVENRRGPIGRRVAFRTIRRALL